LSPFTLRGFADGYRQSEADIGAQALVELPDGSVLASAGSERNQVYRYDQNGPGKQTRSTPLFTLDAPILDLAVDARGQLWAMTGAELLQIDADSGTVLQRLKGPNGDPLTHALAIAPQTGEIYVSSGNGIEIYNPAESNPGKAWRHFSKQRVGDLAFGPDGRLWGIKWTGGAVPAAALDATTDLVSFPLAGRNAGRAELEYRLAGVIDSLAFGAAGSVLDGLLIVSSNLKQRPVVDGTAETPHQAAVWMIELASRRLLQLAAGGTRGESLVATRDGRLLIAETHRIDEIAARRAANVLAVTVPDGALVPLPLNRIGVVFDQAMWLGEAIDSGSVLNPANYRLTMLGESTAELGGATRLPTFNPQTVTWDAATNTAWLELGGQDAGLEAGRYQLEIRATLASSLEVPLNQAYVSTFTALTDLSHQLRLDFSRTRAERASGTVSYELDIVNIGSDDLKAPLMLLLDPGRYFAGSIADGTSGSGDPADLWVLDLTTALHNLGGKLAVGATLTGQTVTLVPASRFAPRAGLADLVKAKLGHGVYAVPQNNLPPQLTVAGLADPEAASAAEATVLPPAQVGQPWSAELEAYDPDSRRVYWQLVQAPAGITLTPSADVASADDGYRHRATLNWTPSASAAADSEILVRVQDSRGGVALKRFPLAVAGGNHAPLIELATALTLHEGETLSLPIIAADADGDPLTLTVRNLPPGAVFDAGSGLLTWVPGYDQAGTYDPVTLVVSDGKTTVSQRCTITVEPGQPQPELKPVSAQTLREGERYALQLVGSVPGWRDTQADSSTLRLEYAAPWLPGGATLNPETGWFEWTPSYNQHGSLSVPFLLNATCTTPAGESTSRTVTRNIVFNVVNANGAPIFEPADTWRVREGQPLRIRVFAFDPDNPEFEPRIRLADGQAAIGPETTAPTVTYQVDGLPEGATFDPETLEIRWTPGDLQAGRYSVTVTASDDGDALGGTPGTPAVSQRIIPIEVANANRAPEIGDLANAFVDRG
ncbi:MAG TPA: putative Ig domain-containing protein, partial [Accumulibacter sp.]|uniref:putative Ig domain-containing protein n=1 Tax=Accumulibacter sp. TaxID=2053492 RepID=UPI002B6A7AD8